MRSVKCEMRLFGLAMVLLAQAAPAAEGTKVTPRRLIVEAANDEYLEAGVTVADGDLIIVRSWGSVVTGSWAGSTGGPFGHTGRCGEGNDKDGALVMKVGTSTTMRVGTELIWVADKSGPLKFRVRDTKFTDNSGQYGVTVVHVPKNAVQVVSEFQVEASNDEWTPVATDFGPDDSVLVVASGTVTARGRNAEARGRTCAGSTPVPSSDDDGGLAVKVGKALQPEAGTMLLGSPGKEPLKFRVRSGNKYEGNAGAYAVRLVKISLTEPLEQPGAKVP